MSSSAGRKFRGRNRKFRLLGRSLRLRDASQVGSFYPIFCELNNHQPRCLALKTSDPVGWQLFSGFQSHSELQRKQHAVMWDFHQEHSVQFLREELELGERFSSEEISSVIYTMYTNSVNMELGAGRGSVTGFYPVFANLNHSCVCNTKTVRLGEQLEVRSLTRIGRGEEIYTQYVSPEKTTKIRRRLLYNKWMFWCHCERCRDPTESQSYLGALLCPERRCEGVCLARDPTEEETDYSCQQCGFSLTKEEVATTYRQAEADLRTPDSRYDLIEHLERFLFTYSRLLHPSNHLCLSVKQKLGALYGNCPPYSMERLTRPQLERKLQVCLDVLQSWDRVDPGVNKWRQSVVTEINKARIALKLRRQIKYL